MGLLVARHRTSPWSHVREQCPYIQNSASESLEHCVHICWYCTLRWKQNDSQLFYGITNI